MARTRLNKVPQQAAAQQDPQQRQMPMQAPAAQQQTPAQPMQAAMTPGAPQAQPMQGMQPREQQSMPPPGAGQMPPQQGMPAAAPAKDKLGEEQCIEWNRILNQYRAGKARLDQRLVSAERWWKMRNQYEEQTRIADPLSGMHSGSAWLHNVIVNKHADMIQAYPQPNILPREEGDKVTAWALSEIIPVVLEQNHFEDTYSDCCWQKLKTGTGVYQVVWDAKKNGIGDITINKVDVLTLFWEPGIDDIQNSKYVFHTEWRDKDDLMYEFPELEEKTLQSVFEPRREPTDDFVSTDGKVIVIDVYYKKHGILQYAKYVGSNILYATENDPQLAEVGLYNHSEYPFIFDKLYPVEQSPCGYGYIDYNCNSQGRIDMLNAAFLKNVITSATPRYFERMDGGINEEEFLNINNTIVHVMNGTLGEDDIRQITPPTLATYSMNYFQQTIQELRETAGNNDASTGATPASVTSASGIAALQEAAGRGSKACVLGSYRAFSKLCNQVIELIRQFYDLPRQFRITGNMGKQRFIEFSNQQMQPQPQGLVGGMDMGYKLPVYDVQVEPQKATKYTQLAQNELAKELFGLGLFAPQNVDQALMVLGMMDFDGKEELMGKISQQGTMFQKLQMYQSLALSLAQAYQPELVPGLAQDITGAGSGGGPMAMGAPGMGGMGGQFTDSNGDGTAEHPFVEKSREQANDAGQPDAGRAVR